MNSKITRNKNFSHFLLLFLLFHSTFSSRVVMESNLDFNSECVLDSSYEEEIKSLHQKVDDLGVRLKGIKDDLVNESKSVREKKIHLLSAAHANPMGESAKVVQRSVDEQLGDSDNSNIRPGSETEM